MCKMYFFFYKRLTRSGKRFTQLILNNRIKLLKPKKNAICIDTKKFIPIFWKIRSNFPIPRL